MMRPLWAEVNLRALRNNFKAIRIYIGARVKIIATIKQSAYGHGLIPVARELFRQGVDFFGVGSIEEAISLREDGFKGSIIVLSSILDKFAGYFVQHNITPTVVSMRFAGKLNKEAAKKKKVIPVHVKIDTGMGRLGYRYKHAHDFVRQLSKLRNIFLEGIYTHFPAADSDPEFTNYQIKAFNCFIWQMKKAKISFKFSHCANSIGIINYPDSHFNMVRPGLILYGIKPSSDVDICVDPILSWKSKVIFIKRVDKGSSIGYGRTYVADRARNIATIAVGYADGYPWALSNRSRVIINNNFFNIAGRICMDHIMIDLGYSKNVKQGEEVILIGENKNKKIAVEDLAQWAKTIPYEIISCISSKIPRIYKFSSIRENAAAFSR